MKNFTLLVLLVLITRCTNTILHERKAHIYKRNLVNNGRIMIHYSFMEDGKLISDSTELKNVVIPDSVTVVLSSDNPRHYIIKEE